MCAALPLLGSAVTPLFFGSLAIQGAQMVAQNRLASRTATAQYAAARRSADSAEESFTQQQEGAGANLKETRASQAQKRLAASIQGRQAQGADLYLFIYRNISSRYQNIICCQTIIHFYVLLERKLIFRLNALQSRIRVCTRKKLKIRQRRIITIM